MTSRKPDFSRWGKALRKLAPVLLDTGGIILLSGFTMASAWTAWNVALGGWVLGLGVLAINRVHFG